MLGGSYEIAEVAKLDSIVDRCGFIVHEAPVSSLCFRIIGKPNIPLSMIEPFTR